MAKKEAEARTITLDEFAKGIGKRETRAGFLTAMHADRTTPHTLEEWDQLLALFTTRPTDTPWSEWVTKGGN
jgi:hypothetical protein